MATSNHLVELWLLLFIVSIILALSIERAEAQSTFTPIPAGGSASIFIEGKAFYVQSGATSTRVTQQTFSIDLSSTWNTSAPPYTKLKDGINDNRFPNCLLSDGISWLGVSNKAWVTYNLVTGNITQRAPLNTFSGLQGLSAALDRVSGEVVIPNGNIDNVTTTTLYIAPSKLTSRADTQPGVVSGLVRYSLAWSESAQKTILFGGVGPSGEYYASLFQRDSSTGGSWSPITTTGGPSARESTCMVPAFNGATMIVFGGSGPLDVPLGDIFMYDVANATWRQGSAAGPGVARSSHACAISGDSLIVWGGYTNSVTRSPPASILAVYNLSTHQWVNTYNAVIVKPIPTSISTPITSTSGPTSTVSSGSGSNSGSSPTPIPEVSRSGNNIGAVVGGIIAAVVALLGLGFVLWRRYRLEKVSTFSHLHGQQGNEGSLNYKEPTEKSRDPHAGPDSQPYPEPASGARHPQMDKPQQHYGYISETQPVFSLKHPQTDMPLDQFNSVAEIQPAFGMRHPQSEMPQKHAPETQAAYDLRHSRFEVVQDGHGHGHFQQRNKRYPDFQDPVARYNHPHGDPNTQPPPRIPPRPKKGIRHPQLDILKRERELIAEMEMLRMDRGKAPAQHTERWSLDRNGGGAYHT